MTKFYIYNRNKNQKHKKNAQMCAVEAQQLGRLG